MAAQELKRPASPSSRVDGPPKKRSSKGRVLKQLAKKEKARRDKPSTLPLQVVELLGGRREGEGWELVYGTVVEVRIVSLSAGGEGLGLSPDGNWVIVVPFVVPGDLVRAKLYKQGDDWGYAHADLVEVVEPGEWRDGSLVRCKYFGKCSGCQYQMVPYERQLELKRNVVERAYKYLSDDVPPTLPTLPSPLEYGYRTKLTPHFNPPRASQTLAIGFEKKDGKGVMDIEECPLASATINARLTEERARVKETISTFKRGATLLLRESADDPPVCITDHHALVTERVGDLVFRQNAGSFFQNNSSILPSLIAYVEAQLRPSDKYLVDAYCGSGLFGIALAKRVERVTGIEISAESIKYAKDNAQANGAANCTFRAGLAERIFDGLDFAADETTVIIDPPRKGCDDLFLDQLVAFRPASVVYVSCNVHSQARDVGKLSADYRLESLRGADLFPQSHHCESIAVLRRR